MFAWQATVQDEQGNAVVNPSVTVYLEDGVTLAAIYNEDGSPKDNPFIGTLEGFVQFWAQAGGYRIVGVYNDDETSPWSVTLDAPAIRAEEAANRAEAAAVLAEEAVRNFVTPLSFGAIGDGIADDTLAIAEWASKTERLRVTDGAVYRITSPIEVRSARIDATSSVFFYDPPTATEDVMFTLTEPGARWTGGEIDGNRKSRGGIDSAAGRIHINNVEAHGFRSFTGRADAIRLAGPDGGEVSGCEIYDVWSQGNDTPGDGTGPARGIMISHDAPLNAPYRVVGNTVYDIWGEEGDGIHMLLYGGTYPFYDCANSVFARNRVYGCGRRCIKIQASGIKCLDNNLFLNGGNPPASQAENPPIATINVIISSNVTVRNNIVRCSQSVPGISVDYSGYEGSCSGLVIGGNEFVAGNDIALYINGATNFVVQQNTFRDVGRSIAIGNSARGYIGLQSIIGSVASGTSADITVQSTCSHLVVENTLGLSGTRYALVDMRAPKSIVRDTYNLRDSGGAAVFSTATSVGSIIDGVISSNDAGGNAVSAPAAQIEVGNVRSFGTTSAGFSNGRGGRLWWSPGNPATVSPDIRHYRGDVSMNDGAGSENGWRCTVAGVPGTWVSF